MQTAVQHTSSDLAPTATANLSPVQAQVAAILAQGQSITAAARHAGIHRSTIYQWLQHSSDFETAVQAAQEEYLATVTDEMRDLSSSALRTLRGVLDNPETHDGIRLKAALAVLQRPHYPNHGWHLPDRIESTRQRQMVDTLAEIKAQYDMMRMQGALDGGSEES